MGAELPGQPATAGSVDSLGQVVGDDARSECSSVGLPPPVGDTDWLHGIAPVGCADASLAMTDDAAAFKKLLDDACDGALTGSAMRDSDVGSEGSSVGVPPLSVDDDWLGGSVGGALLTTLLRISKLYWKVFVRRPPSVISALRSKASSEETIAEAFASENVTTSVQPRRVT